MEYKTAKDNSKKVAGEMPIAKKNTKCDLKI